MNIRRDLSRYLCLALAAGTISAQTASISGTVTDTQAALPGVAVTLRSDAIAARSTTTDEKGAFLFERIATGSYDLTFAREGFEGVTRMIFITTGSAVVDIALHPGAMFTKVDVTDVAGKATASRMDIPDRELPVQVSSISDEVLREQGTNDLVNALKNASGVSARRFYGIYEYYTVRGFSQSEVQLVDGMKLEGNRINTQLNNVEQVEVLKGPSSILYGGQALSGAINIIRKKPQGAKAYDFFYRGGRWNLQQVGGGATGPITDRLLYRVDTSYEHNSAWRGAGADRFNLSPSVTWLINDGNRVTVHESVNRDDFKGDGGIPLSVASIPNFDLGTRFSTTSDFSHVRDSQTVVLFNSNISPSWQFRDGFFYRWTNDQYFVTEGLSYDPAANQVDRYALYFQHHRRPVLNQADVVGRLRFLGMRHTILMGYEFQNFATHTDRTPDGGDFFPEPVTLSPYHDPQGPITEFPIVQVDYATNRIHALYWQDQISVTEKLKANIGGRFDDYTRIRRSDPWANGAPTSQGAETRLEQTAYTYRAGLVYLLPASQQIYASSSSSFQPVTVLPADGRQLDPETGRNYEFGHRWQGAQGRITTNLAFYKLERNNVVINRGRGVYDQAGQQSSKGIELDIQGDLGRGIRLIANYGYTLPRFDNYVSGGVDLSGNRPTFTQRHAANVWLTKMWTQRFVTSIGMTYLGPMFTNFTNTIKVGGWTTFSGSASYRFSKFEWSVTANNLFNRQRYFTGSDYEDQVYPGSPINVFTTLRLRF